MDMQAGLDSWMGDIDKDMLKYYQKSLGKKVDMWSIYTLNINLFLNLFKCIMRNFMLKYVNKDVKEC